MYVAACLPTVYNPYTDTIAINSPIFVKLRTNGVPLNNHANMVALQITEVRKLTHSE
jgi:hypothetical protein